MVTIIFESHGTTFDNENKLSSGHADAELSPKGVENAKELGKRYAGQDFDAIFCSDLKRSYETAEIAFGNKFPIIKDPRLRECNYGELTRISSELLEPQKVEHIIVPFPDGESYEDCSARMKEFLDELKQKYEGKKVMVIGHRATQYGLEHWINGKSLEELFSIKWTWQPGWQYQLP